MKPSFVQSAEPAPKVRLDRLLVDVGMAASRQRSQALILAGQVLADGQKIEKCGALVRADAELRILGETLRYVSRGGLKLEGALTAFGVDPAGKTCLDLGASTGGFTDCLLQRGAAHVVAVDAGTNQLDWKLRTDGRVQVLEKTNARYLQRDQLGGSFDLVTMDLSFISATLILPVLPLLIHPGSVLLVLVKPQFEVGHSQVGKGGVVREPALHQQAMDRVSHKAAELGFEKMATAPSSILGAAGNREFFLHAIWPSRG